MDFGLGLILTFTDKASVGLAGVSNTIGGLTATAENASTKIEALSGTMSSLASLGAGLTTMVTAPIVAFMGKITQYGIARASFVEDMHLAFTSLMGDAKTASDYMNRLMGFAKTTPYTYEGLTNAAQALISYGISENEILTETKGKFSGILQALGDWAGATGKGEAGLLNVADILGKISAEGSVSTIRIQQLQRAGVQASKIIGNMYNKAEAEATSFIKGMNTEQFLSDLTKGIEEGTKGINGITGAMTGMMGNLKNTWTGAKDTFVSSLKNAGLQLMGAYIDDMGVQRYKFLEDMTGSLNDISTSVKQIPSILQPLMDSVQNLMKKGSKLILKFTTLWNGLGEGTKKAIGKIISKLVILGPTLLIVGKIGSRIIGVFTQLKGVLSLVTTSLNMTKGSFALFSVTLGAFALAWKYDFLGLRTSVEDFVSNTIQSFNFANSAVSGSVSEMVKALDPLQKKSDFFSKLTLKFAKLIVFVRTLSDAWSDNEISEDLFLKARELGVLPLIECILDLKYRFEFFKKGFIKGWENIKDKFIEFINVLGDNPIFSNLISGVEDFLKALSSGDTDSWYKFGESFAYITAGVLAFIVAVKALKGVISIVRGVASAFKAVKNVISSIVSIGDKLVSFISVVKLAFSDIVGFFQLVSEYGLAATLEGLLGSAGATIAGIVSFVGGIGLALWGFIEQLINGFDWLWEVLKWVGIVLGVIGAVALGICTGPVGAIVGAIVGVVTLIIELVVTFWNEISSFFVFIGTWLYDNVICPIADFFVGLWESICNIWNSICGFFMGIWNTLVSLWNGLCSFFSSVVSWIYDNLIAPIINFFWTYIYPIVAKIYEIFAKIVEIISALLGFVVGWIYENVICPIGDFFVGLWNGIVAIWGSICDFFVGLWNGILSVITTVVDAICSVFNTIVTFVNDNIIQPIVGFFVGLWESIVGIVTNLVNSISGIFKSIVDFVYNNVIKPIGDFFTGLWKTISDAFQGVIDTVSGIFKNIMNGIFDVIDGIVNTIIGGINGVIDMVNAIPGIDIEKIELLHIPRMATGGIVDKPTMSLIGEAGTEAVVPLENNTKWLGIMADMIVEKIATAFISATKSLKYDTGNNITYVTNTNTNKGTETSRVQHIDKSIHFENGAIQITANGCSDEEAERLANKILRIIKRKQELDDMLMYV